MGIVLNRFNERQITPIKDVMLFEKIFPTNGIIQGCALTHLGSNQVSIAAGTGIIQGRDFTVTAETLLVQLASAGTMPGRIYIRYNLSDTVTPAQILSVCATTLPALTQDADFNIANGIWEEELATYSATTTAISGLTTTIATITNLVKDYIKNVNTITEEGYAADARQLNPNISGTLANYVSNLGTATLLATCTSTTFSAFTITDIDTYRYIGTELTNGAGACIHYTQMPISIFKTKNSTTKTLASEYNANVYSAVYYSSDTQIYASTTNASYPLLIYGIK